MRQSDVLNECFQAKGRKISKEGVEHDAVARSGKDIGVNEEKGIDQKEKEKREGGWKGTGFLMKRKKENKDKEAYESERSERKDHGVPFEEK